MVNCMFLCFLTSIKKAIDTSEAKLKTKVQRGRLRNAVSDLAGLLDGVTDGNLHGAIPTGHAVAREVQYLPR